MEEGEPVVTETLLSNAFDFQDASANPVGFCVVRIDLDGNGEPVDWTYVYVNDYLARFEGHTPEEMTGHTFFELFPERSRDRVQLHYDAAYHGKPYCFDDSSRELGKVIHVDVYPVGKVGYCACVLYDIEEAIEDAHARQKERESLIAAYEDEHRRNMIVQEYSKIMGFNFPLVIEVDYLNDSYELIEYESFLNKRAVGFDNIDDMIRGGASTLPDPEEARRFWELFNRQAVIDAFRNGQDTIELRHWQNGIDDKVHFMDTFVVCAECSDNAIRSISLSRCIDEEAERDHAWRVAEERLEVVDGLSVICALIVMGDLRTHEYKIVKCSDEMRGMLDFNDVGNADSVANMVVDSLIRTDMREEARAFLDFGTLDERIGQARSVFMDYATQDGKWRKGRFVVLNRDEAGHVEKVLFLAREFTEEKKRELDYMAQLKSAADEADRANRSKTDFLRRMSHDIRTPLNGIIGMLRIMDRNKGDKAMYEECMEKIVRSSDYLLSIVNDVLEVSKMESGGIELEHKPFDLGQLLLNTLPIVATNASQHSVLFTGGRDDTHIVHRYIMGSPTHLNRVLMNIASNAVKYNRRGGSMKIYCNELRSEGEIAEYEFVCEDTGLGMGEEFQKRAFEPLSREGKQTTTGFSGSGLGLSIVKDIVTKMGGTIDLKSKENVGTTIRIVIPFQLDKNHEQTRDASEVPETLDLTGMRALLVEDNEINMEIARIMLEDLGLSVVCADNGRAAVDAFGESKPYAFDFVFMDVMMPVMDGLSATRAIREMRRVDAGSVPIIAMTANAFAEDKQACLDAGMNDHIGKPVEPSEVVKVVASFLEG